VIFVDPRAGSNELTKPLGDAGLPVEEATLEYGDLSFIGRGEKGAPVAIGIEHKKVSDLVQSLGNGRLQGHQLPGMLEHYDRCWLIVEGDWTSNAGGQTTVFAGRGVRRPLRGAPLAVELDKWLLGLEVRGGIHIVRCPTRKDTVRFILALYRWWTDKDLDDHKSHIAIHAPDLDTALREKKSDQFIALAQWPGIGYKTAGAVEAACGGNIRQLMMWPESKWAELTTEHEGKTRRLGNARAKRVMNFLAGMKE
jgi:ERCC4-type nuclease